MIDNSCRSSQTCRRNHHKQKIEQMQPLQENSRPIRESGARKQYPLVYLHRSVMRPRQWNRDEQPKHTKLYWMTSWNFYLPFIFNVLFWTSYVCVRVFHPFLIRFLYASLKSVIVLLDSSITAHIHDENIYVWHFAINWEPINFKVYETVDRRGRR